VIDFPSAGLTVGQIFTLGALAWQWDGTKWVASGSAHKYIVGAFVPGLMTASQWLLLHSCTKAITLPANLGAYLGHATAARGTVNATGSTTIIVQKAVVATPGTFTNVGTIVVSAAAMVAATFTTTSGAAVTFAQGDTLALVAPASPDATFTNFTASLVAYET
jgi:hypothetical protein